VFAAPGDLDRSFCGNGRVRTTFDGTGSLSDIARAPGGKIVASGEARGEAALARYRRDGSLDRSFSGDGKRTADFGDEGDFVHPEAVALQDDGKIVLAGTVGRSSRSTRPPSQTSRCSGSRPGAGLIAPSRATAGSGPTSAETLTSDGRW
jgi:hypothetical protein